jgi:hypothetical protein
VCERTTRAQATRAGAIASWGAIVNVVVRGTLVTAIVAAVSLPLPAWAYRPFDQTDAGVAALHTMELELGPVGYVHQPFGSSYAPGFVFNYGVVDRVELVLDAHQSFLFGGPQVDARRRRLDTGLLAKGVLREGSLQGGSGPSVAAEIGALLPALPVAGGVGGSLAFIASQRWPAVTVHFDVEGDITREDDLAFTGGAIVEGPDAWTIRPVCEVFAATESGYSTTVSGLIGGIWQINRAVALDTAARAARQEGVRTVELRAGLTWTFGI